MIIQTIALSGVVQNVSTLDASNQALFSKVSLFGYSSFGTTALPVANGGTVYVGTTTGKLPWKVLTGQQLDVTFSYNIPQSSGDNITGLFVNGTSGDSLYMLGYLANR